MSVERGSPGLRIAAVFGLVAMAVWTLVIKFLAPVLWAVAERAAGRPTEAPVMWDFWWLAHLVLAGLLWRRHRFARSLGWVVATVEITIVAVKLALYFRAPEPTFWRLLWLTNKLYVLAFFVAFAIWLTRPAARRELAGSTRKRSLRGHGGHHA